MKYLRSILIGALLGISIAILVDEYQTYERARKFQEFIDSHKAQPTTLQSLIDEGVLRIDTIKSDTIHLSTRKQ